MALAREHAISQAAVYTWKNKYAGLEVNEAQRLKALEDENRRLKHLVAPDQLVAGDRAKQRLELPGLRGDVAFVIQH